MSTTHKLICGTSEDMSEIQDSSVQLVVTSPPYFNAPFDYKNLYSSYNRYISMLKKMAKESIRIHLDLKECPECHSSLKRKGSRKRTIDDIPVIKSEIVEYRMDR